MAVLRYQLNQALESAENSAFQFVAKQEKFEQKQERKKKAIDKVGGLSPFWLFLSVIGIPLAIIFAIYESNMAQQAIKTLLDPLNMGTVNSNMVSLIGAGLAILAMFMGHIFYEGFKQEVNEITGRTSRKIGIPFYFSVVGLFSYIGFQYYLVQAAGEGSEEFTSFAMIAIGVAILEILVGVLILGKSLSYMLIFLLSIQLWMFSRAMAKYGRRTNRNYRDYRSLRDVWNNENPDDQVVLEGNPNIRKALAYYGGISLDEARNQSSSPEVLTAGVQEQETSMETIPDNTGSQMQGTASEQEIEEFINNDDDNLTF